MIKMLCDLSCLHFFLVGEWLGGEHPCYVVENYESKTKQGNMINEQWGDNHLAISLSGIGLKRYRYPGQVRTENI